ncbi:MAG: DUF87 domain-containing protein [Nanoarchaeota archaeon]
MIDIKERLFTSEVKKLIPILGRVNVERLSKAYLLGDEDTRLRIFELIDVAKAAVFSENELGESILMEPPEKEAVAKGELTLGSVLYGKKKMYPLRFEKQRLLMHMGIFGSSGYGKTNLAHKMILEMANEELPILIFDFSKRNYRKLLRTPLKDRIDIYTVGRNTSPFKFNPLVPPEGIQMSQWMKEFSSVFDHAYFLMGGGRHIIMKAFDGAFDESEKTPRLRDLKDWINEYAELKLPMREKNWIATAARPLDSLVFREIGEIFDCDVGVRPSDFFKKGKITILELDALDTNDKTFFIEILLQWIRDWLLVNDKREELIGAIILEEAHHVLNREKSIRTGSETVMDLLFREIRELGLGIIYLDQHPSLVSYPALGNTSTHIYMNLGLDTKQSSDILDATHMLGLDYEEEGSYLRRLPVGQGFMLCRNFEFPRPFLVNFDEVKFTEKVIKDEEVAELMKTYDKIVSKPVEHKVAENIPKEVVKKTNEITSDIQKAANDLLREIKLLTEESREYAKEEYMEDAKEDVVEEPEERTEIIEPKIETPKLEDVSTVDMPLDKIDKQAWKIIDVVGNGHGAFASQIYKNARVSGTVFNEKIETLLDLGLIKRVGGKSGKNKLHFYYLTEKGERTFDSNFRRYEGAVDADLSGLLELFSLVGWKATRKVDILEITKEDEILPVAIIDYTDKNKMYERLKINKHFVCANETLKNILVQQAAKRSLKKPGLTIFVSTFKDFEDNTKFDKIEFDI